MNKVFCLFCTFVLSWTLISAKKDSEDDIYRPHKRMERPKDDGAWKKKDVRDYNDIDLDNLYDQWEEDEEEIPVDELPPWEVEPPPIDMRKVNLRDSDSILKHGKKYRTLMMFATLAGNLNEKETEKQSALWESSLYNAGIQVKRTLTSSEDSDLYSEETSMDDGFNSVQIRDFLVQQENCWEVNLDSKTYDGKAKLNKDQYKPMTKEEAKTKKEEEAKKKAEQAKKKAEKEKGKKGKADKKMKTEL